MKIRKSTNLTSCCIQSSCVENLPKPKEQLPENSLPVYLLQETKYEIINVTDKKGDDLQTCENAHPKNTSGSQTNLDITTSAKNNHVKGTETNMENTDLEDTTSPSETNKTTEKEFPTL